MSRLSYHPAGELLLLGVGMKGTGSQVIAGPFSCTGNRYWGFRHGPPWGSGHAKNVQLEENKGGGRGCPKDATRDLPIQLHL